MRSVHTRGSVHAQRARMSPACVAIGTGAGIDSGGMALPRVTFLRPLAPRALPRFLATTDALTPVRAALRLHGSMNTDRPFPNRSPSVTAPIPRGPFRRHSPRVSAPPLLHATPQRSACSVVRVGLRLYPAGSSATRGRIAFVSYGLVHHLRLLPTPPRSGAVTLGFRPESVCLERTC